MSNNPVNITTIGEIFAIEKADRLELVQVAGTDFTVVVGKGQFKEGDRCIYVPVDSILPKELEDYLFPPGSKITLSKSRVRATRIRGAMSYGMIIELDDELIAMYPTLKIANGDVSSWLGITKYEPPEPKGLHTGGTRVARKGNPDFLKYTDINNFKFYPKLFEADDEVYITEKIHGTSARYGMLPTHVTGFWKKVKKFFHKLPEFEYCYGSRNVQLQDGGKVYYDKDVYGKVGKELDLATILQPGEQLFGEIVGQGIQKGYSYGCGQGEFKFLAYDVKQDGRFLDVIAFKNWCDGHGIERVPQIYVGLFGGAKLDELKSGPSLVVERSLDGVSYVPTQAVREGAVIKPLVDTVSPAGRKVLKLVSDDFLLGDNSDNH